MAHLVTMRAASVGAIGVLLAGIIGAGAAVAGSYVTAEKSALSSEQQARDEFLRTERRIAYGTFVTHVRALDSDVSYAHAVNFRHAESQVGHEEALRLEQGLDQVSGAYDQISVLATESTRSEAEDVLDLIRPAVLEILDGYCRSNPDQDPRLDACVHMSNLGYESDFWNQDSELADFLTAARSELGVD